MAGIVGFCSSKSRKVRHAAICGARVGILILLWLVASRVGAQTFKTLYSFSGPDGAYPACGLTLSGSTLYGATTDYIPGIGLGTVFSLPVTGGSLNWSTPFSPSTGWIPCSAPRLLLIGSNLYGTANGAGGGGIGTVFCVPVTGGNVTVLGSFNSSSGGNPHAGVTLSADGSTLYGTTGLYSTYGEGAVFSMPIGGGSPSPLASFNGTGTDNKGPLIRIGSILYGTTGAGGAYQDGTVFSIPVTGGSLTTLCSFNGTNGANPEGVLTLVGTTLYGTTVAGGANNDGTVFSLPVTGGAPTTLLSFSGTNGANPHSGLTPSGSTLYGTTNAGGTNNDGTVFSLPIGGGMPTILHSFNGADGATPCGDLTLNGSNLYGTTYGGGSNGHGTVFALTLASPASITLGSVFNATIISGGTASLGATVSNSAASGANNLNYTLTAAVPIGNASLGTVTPGSGNLTPSASQSSTVSASSSNLGVNTIRFTATDSNASNSPQTIDATLTVLGHTAPNLTLLSGNNQTVIVGATGVTAGLKLSNGTLNQTGLALLDVNSLGTFVTGSTGGKLVASGSTQSYTGNFSTSTLGTQNQTFSLNVGDDKTLSGASSATALSTTATLTVHGHSAPSLSLLSGNNQTVIVGANGVTAGLKLSNGTQNQSGLASLDVNSLGTLVTGSTGGKLVASGSTQSYTGNFSTSALGTQTQTFSLNVGDDQTLLGASLASNLSTSASLTVLGHTAPSLKIISGNNQTVIIGATGINAALTLFNGALNQTGLASLDVNSLGTLVTGSTGNKLVASGSTQSYTAALSTGTLGMQTQVFSINLGDDHTLLGASSATILSTSATLTVTDHSNASLSSGTNLKTQTINFGNFLKGATAPPFQSFTIYNRANTTVVPTANLKLTDYTPAGDPAFTAYVSSFSGLAAGGSSGSFVTLNTNNYTTTGVTTLTMSSSQLVDDSPLPGAGSNNNGTIIVTLQGNVGTATADASNSPTKFGTALIAPIAKNASYANLESKASATAGSGGAGMVGSKATILAGTASVATTASMAWRTGATNPETGIHEGFIGDVVDLSGMGVVPGQPIHGSLHTDKFVLQMSYDSLAVEQRTGLSELAAANAGFIQMEYLDQGLDAKAGTADDLWELAVLGNFGSTNNHFVGVGSWIGDMTLGDYGVDVQSHAVWAVLDHNSQFAVVPEPSTLALLGAFGLIGWAWRFPARARLTSRCQPPRGLSQDPCSCRSRHV